jgi:hypothetical protein
MKIQKSIHEITRKRPGLVLLRGFSWIVPLGNERNQTIQFVQVNYGR